MVKCAFCDKEIKSTFDPLPGQTSIGTHYWYGDINDGILFCGPQCSLDSHHVWNEEWYILKRNRKPDGQ